MENNELIFVHEVTKFYPPVYNENCSIISWFAEDFIIKEINNSEMELILTYGNKTDYVPFSQLKWGFAKKFLNKTDPVYVIRTILLKVPIDIKSDLTCVRISSPSTILFRFYSSFSVQEKNLKRSNVIFCIRENFCDEVCTIAKYPIPITKILLFVAGHTDPKSPVSYLIKDIFPLIYEFYQQIYPLLESNNE